MVLDGHLQVDGQAHHSVPVSALKARSSTLRRALESSNDKREFSVVAPAGFLDLWLKSVQLKGPPEADMRDLTTAEAFMLLQVRTSTPFLVVSTVRESSVAG